MLDDHREMRIKRSLKKFVTFIFFLFIFKFFTYISTNTQPKLLHKKYLILQEDPFDDKEDPTFDKFQRANDILHGKKNERHLIKSDIDNYRENEHNAVIDQKDINNDENGFL